MYLIDGYNLLYSTDFDTREELITAVNKFCDYRKKRAKIVFDGYSNDDLNTEFVQVDFGGDADKFIAEIIETCDNPSYYVLVTSDREILYLARQKKMQTIKSGEFNLSVPETITVESDESPDFFMTDSEVEKLESERFIQKI